MAEVALADRVPGWVKRHVPTQESVQRNRFLRPFAKPLSNPALWRLHRRSVPRAVALGLGVGVIIPFMHVAIAAILAIPARANVVISALVPLLLTPFYPPLYYAAYHVGRWELRHDRGVVDAATAQQVTGELQRVLFWLHHASGSIAIGILTLAIAIAVTGYVLAAVLWRWLLANKWRRRQSRRGAAA